MTTTVVDNERAQREEAHRNAAAQYREARQRYWDEFAEQLDHWDWIRGYYQERLSQVYKHLIPPKMRVLELGCGQGDLIGALEPARGLGIDLSEKMIARARSRHPQVEFVQADVQEWLPAEKFDFIILSDLVNDVRDVQRTLELVSQCTLPSTRIVMNAYSRLWQGPRWAAEMMGAAKLQLDQNWLTRQDLANLLYLSGFETIRTFSEIMWPVRTPWLDTFFNRYLVKLGLFSWMGLTNFLVARPQPKRWIGPPPVVSVVVPARNEAGNVRRIFEETPDMGIETELIFVEGHSSDNTFEAIANEMRNWPNRRVKLFRQTGKGKGDAVRLGFANASGDVLMILDADLTVPPEDLPRFFDAWYSGKGEFVNGVRLVYPMEDESMRFFNFLGNKFFSLAFSWLLSQSVKDTLCGTKVLSRRDYEMIAANRSYFGDFDPFGDFDLLFGAAKYSLKIVDLPVRYRERTYGTTNIQRWTHGWLLLQMVATAMRRIKFV
ncbi:MAG TPA: glycosyltransferase [Candidatus Acidoferrum sp.]|jgi:2-polyprenyl-3-methyl-5-hydroxy-6-metoxy-1,4-benzoquinol methylase|nr:glycosyltransferase [Candidatus Acidoferrum sp.]